MADKDQEIHSIAVEESKELQRKKRIKCLAYTAAFAVFQTIIILVFALTVMRIKSPKFRLSSITVNDLAYSTTSPSFNIRFTAEITVKNTNFGHFKFDNSTVFFAYNGIHIGEAFVAKARARARSTKKMNVTVDLNSSNVLMANLNLLRRDLNSGVLALAGQSKLSGKVQLMKVMKKKKSTEMSCIIILNLANKAVQDLQCN